MRILESPRAGVGVSAILIPLRAELTVQERADQIAEWVRLTEEKNIGATCADIQRGRGQPKGGINAAVRDLGIDRTEAQRAVKIASITPEARAAEERVHGEIWGRMSGTDSGL